MTFEALERNIPTKYLLLMIDKRRKGSVACFEFCRIIANAGDLRDDLTSSRLLSSPLVTISRRATVRLVVLAIIFPLVMVVISPVVAIVIHREGVPNYGNDYRLVAKAVESAWRRYTDKPLRIIGSIGDLVNGIDFYLADQPSTRDILNPTQTPWIDGDRIGREGVAIVCPEAEIFCLRTTSYYLAYYRTSETEDVVIARRYFSTYDTPVRYKIVIVPPQATHPEHRELRHQTQ